MRLFVRRRFTFHNYREGRQYVRYGVDLQMLLTDIMLLIYATTAYIRINNLKATNRAGNEFLKVYLIIK